MKLKATIIIMLLLGACSDEPKAPVPQPPFPGTLWVDPDIITSDDPTSFESITTNGQGIVSMFDYRVNGWITVNAFLFDVIYDDGLTIKVEVNTEIESAASAQEFATKYATSLGRLPTSLRRGVKTIWILKGDYGWGASNGNIIAHTGGGDDYEAKGFLEEAFVHETGHTSLDPTYANAIDWVDAQEKDKNFISIYAQQYPKREDVAETFLMYLAAVHRPDRISPGVREKILTAIPNRIRYLETRPWDLYPLE